MFAAAAKYIIIGVFVFKKNYLDNFPSSLSFFSWPFNSWWISPTISSNWFPTNVMGSILGYWCSTGLSLVIGCWPLRPVEVEDSLISCLSKLKSCLRIIIVFLSVCKHKYNKIVNFSVSFYLESPLENAYLFLLPMLPWQTNHCTGWECSQRAPSLILCGNMQDRFLRQAF